MNIHTMTVIQKDDILKNARENIYWKSYDFFSRIDHTKNRLILLNPSTISALWGGGGKG